MTILIAVLHIVRSIFNYLTQRQNMSQSNEILAGRQSKREYSLLLRALKARRRARQNARKAAQNRSGGNDGSQKTGEAS